MYSLINLMYRRMGYFDDQSGILRRERREREGWNEHLQNTRNFVIEAMQKKECNSAAVLGSGWLLDVPVDEMSCYFKKLYLFDVCHPAAVRKQVKKLKNVELQLCDISGFARPVYHYVKKYRNRQNRPPISLIQPEMDDRIPHFYEMLQTFDFVFSCNILNQLDILLIDYLARFFDLSDEEIFDFRNNVQLRHIALLPRNRSCIVADYEEITFTPEGKEIARKTSVHHPIAQCETAKRWTWKFDTKMTYYDDKITFFEVFASEI